MIKRPFILINDDVRQRVAEFAMHSAPLGWACIFQEPTRSLEQNSAQWPILEAFSAQLLWPVNGKMERLTSEEFKDVLTAGFRKETVRLAAGVDGGMIMLGARTSTMKKAEFSDWLEFLHFVAAERGVDLTRK